MVRSTRFANGLTLLTEKYPGVRSVSVGFWVGAGSGFESPAENGISHFTEHVTFKGTDKYSAFEIAKLFEDYGASVNAFTSKEATCYYFKCIDENLEKCFALLAHIFYESSFADEELDKERNVIVEEINMVEDAPEDICYDKLAESAYRGTGLARTILGPMENVRGFRSGDVVAYTSKMYTPDNTVISVVGNAELDELTRLIDKYVLPKCGNGTCGKKYDEAVVGGGYAEYVRDFEQVNFALAFPSLPFDDPCSAVQNVVSFCLGTGMSSRLFQVLREQKGLVYNVYTACSAYKNNGVFGVYVNTSGKNVAAAAEAVREEIDKLIRGGLTDEELDRAKTQLRSGMLFSLENMLATMNAYGKYALMTGKAYDLEARLAQVAAVGRGDTAEFCRKYLTSGNVSVAYVGKEQYPHGDALYGKFTK